MENSNESSQASVHGYFVPIAGTRSNDSGATINVGELLRRNVWWFMICPLLTAIIFLAFSFAMTPQYRVNVLLAPVEDSSSSGMLSQLGGAIGGLGALAGINLGEGAGRYESIAVLRSKALSTGFINDLNLMPILFADEWDAANGRWRDQDEKDSPSLEDAFRLFDEDLRSISTDRESGLVTLTITWQDREQAAKWANALVDRANSAIRSRAINEYEKSIEYLNAELEKTTVVGIRQAIFSIIESQVEKVMLANVREDFAFTVIDPAVTPDVDDTASPNRPLFLLVGFVFGVVLAAFIALLSDLRRREARCL